MKSPSIVLVLLLALACVLSATPSEVEFVDDMDGNGNSAEHSSISSSESDELSFLQGRFLRQKRGRVHGAMTCDKYPRVCRVPGSKGRDCCRKKCVNVSTDRNNCGKCGKKCKYSEMCCKGKCVNPMFNKSHCGSCGNKCHKGDYCHQGLCSYA